MSEPTLLHASERHRYEIAIEGQLAGFAEYNLVGDAVMFTHTEILPVHEGQGLGSKLARFALADARARALHVIPVCQFFAGYLRRHPEEQDLVREDIRRAFKI